MDGADDSTAMEAQTPDMETQSAVGVDRFVIKGTGMTCQSGFLVVGSRKASGVHHCGHTRVEHDWLGYGAMEGVYGRTWRSRVVDVVEAAQ